MYRLLAHLVYHKQPLLVKLSRSFNECVNAHSYPTFGLLERFWMDYSNDYLQVFGYKKKTLSRLVAIQIPTRTPPDPHKIWREKTTENYDTIF